MNIQFSDCKPPSGRSRNARDGIRLAAVGIGAGALISLALAASLRTYLFGIGPTDVVTLFGMIAALVLITLATSWIPAWRAARVDPLAAFRAE